MTIPLHLKVGKTDNSSLFVSFAFIFLPCVKFWFTFKVFLGETATNAKSNLKL